MAAKTDGTDPSGVSLGAERDQDEGRKDGFCGQAGKVEEEGMELAPAVFGARVRCADCGSLGLGRTVQKWSKRTVKEKVNNAAILTPDQYEKMVTEASKWKCVTPAILVERLKIMGSVARRLMRDMESKGQLKSVIKHNSMHVCTRTTAAQ